MNLTFLHEPELEFANGGTHVDVRYGLLNYGPLDIGEPTAPSQLRVGLVGTQETIQKIQQWFNRCRDGIAAKQSRLGNLFPQFPGFSESSKFQSYLVFHDRWTSPIRQREIDTILQNSLGQQMVQDFASLFLEHGETLTGPGGPQVLVCVPPTDVLAAVDGTVEKRPDSGDQELDEGTDAPGEEAPKGVCYETPGAINTKSAPFGERSFVCVEDGSDLLELEGEVASTE